jgi:hypothetical protein
MTALPNTIRQTSAILRGYILSPGPGNQTAQAESCRVPHSFEVVDSVEAAISVLIVWGKLRSGIHLQWGPCGTTTQQFGAY